MAILSSVGHAILWLAMTPVCWTWGRGMMKPGLTSFEPAVRGRSQKKAIRVLATPLSLCCCFKQVNETLRRNLEQGEKRVVGSVTYLSALLATGSLARSLFAEYRELYRALQSDMTHMYWFRLLPYPSCSYGMDIWYKNIAVLRLQWIRA